MNVNFLNAYQYTSTYTSTARAGTAANAGTTLTIPHVDELNLTGTGIKPNLASTYFTTYSKPTRLILSAGTTVLMGKTVTKEEIAQAIAVGQTDIR